MKEFFLKICSIKRKMQAGVSIFAPMKAQKPL